MSCRLIVESEPRPGIWNMAFDEALLEAASRRNESILRLYRWSEPTLSLGYFQKTVPPELPRALHLLPQVRRLSGGGAILHHFEWTYSCAIPRTHPIAQNTEYLYEVVHGAIIRALGSLHVHASLRGDSTRGEAFLCFLRGDARDVIVAKQKVAGSAQRRRRGAVLQHGSLLLKKSDFASAVPGLVDLAPELAYDPWLGAEEFVSAISPTLFNESPAENVHPEDLKMAAKLLGEYEPTSSSASCPTGRDLTDAR